MGVIASRELKVNIIGDSKSLERALRNSGDAASTFGSKMGKAAKVIGVAMLAAGAAVTAGFIYTLKRGFDELSESQKVLAQTEAGLKSTGGAANITAKEITGLAESLSLMSGVDDEVIQQGENLLLTFTKVRNEVGKGNDVFNRATTAALDLSVRGFGSMDAASKMLGKALNDPIRGMGALGKAGVQFTDSQKETIKSLVESGKQLEAQKLILKEVETQVGGSAKAYGETLPGQLAKARNAFDEIAGKLATKFLPALTGALDFINRNWGKIGAVFDGVASGVSAAFDKIGDVAGKFIAAKGFKAKIKVVWTGVKEAAQGLASLLGKFFWSGWTTEMGGAGGAMAKKMGGTGKTFHQGLLQQLAGQDWGAIGKAIFDGIVNAMKDVGKIGKRLAAIFSEAIGAVDWVAVGRTLAPGLIAMVVTALSLALDPTFWVQNWELGLAGLIVALGGPLGRMGARLGIILIEKMVAPLASLLGPRLAAAVLRGLGMLGGLISGAFSKLEGVIRSVFGRLGGLAVLTFKVLGIAAAIAAIQDFATMVAGALAGAATAVASWAARTAASLAGAVASWATAAANLGRAVVTGVLSGIANLASTVASAVARAASAIASAVSSWTTAAANLGRAIVTGVVSGLTTLVTTVAGWIQRLWAWLTGQVGTATGNAKKIGLAIPVGILAGLVAGWGAVAGWLGGLGAKVISAVGNAGQWLLGKGKEAITGLWNGMRSIWGSVSGWLGGLGGMIAGAVGGLGGILVGAGSAVFQGLWDGMKSKFESVKGFLSGVGGTIAGLKGPEKKDKEILRPAGIAIIAGLLEGMLAKYPELLRFVKTIASTLVTGVSSPEAIAEAKAAGGKLGMALVANAPLIKTAMKELGKGATTEIINGFLGKAPEAKAELARLLREAIKGASDAAIQEAARQKGLWASTFGALAQAGLDAIAAKYAGWKAPALKALEALDYAEMWKDLNATLKETKEAFGAAFAEGIRLTGEVDRLAGVMAQLKAGKAVGEVAGLTEEEKAKMLGMTPEEAVAFINEQQAAVLAAQTANNATALAALTAFEDAKLAIERQKLVERAAAQEAAHQADILAEQTRFANLLKKIQASGPVTAAELRKLWAKFGIDFFAAGEAWSQALADGLNSEASKAAVQAAARAIAQIVENNIKPQKSPAKEGPLSTFDMYDAGRQYGTDFAAGLKSSAGVVAQAARAVAGAASGASPGRRAFRSTVTGEGAGFETGQLDPVITSVINVYVSGVVGNPQQVARAITPAISEELRRRERRGAPVISGAF